MCKWNTSSCGIGFGRCSRHCSIWSRISEPSGTQHRNMKHTGAGIRWNTLMVFHTNLGPEKCPTPLDCSLVPTAPGTGTRKHILSQEKGRRISPVPTWLDILSAWYFPTVIAQVWLFTIIFHAKCVIYRRSNPKKLIEYNVQCMSKSSIQFYTLCSPAGGVMGVFKACCCLIGVCVICMGVWVTGLHHLLLPWSEWAGAWQTLFWK